MGQSRTFEDERPVAAVDFDGTLCTDCYPHIGKPKWVVIWFCKWLQRQGWIIVLWTCREYELLSNAKDACISWGLHCDYYNENAAYRIKKYCNDSRKVGADLYLDNLGLNPTRRFLWQLFKQVTTAQKS